MRILVVEDTVLTRTILERTLKKWGYDAVSVGNIDDAAQLLLREPVRFVITDWMMPGGDGPTLCRRIRSLDLPYYTYIILVTSLEDAQSLVSGMEAGADDFIHKPIQFDELRARIHAGERVLQLEKTLQERNAKLQDLSNKLLRAHEIIERDLRLAGHMQRALLPTCASSIKGIAIDGLFCPSAHVSGDIFNFFRLDEQYTGFYAVDVSGHGVAAAMLSFTLSRLLTPEMNLGSPLKYSLSEAPFYGIVKDPCSVMEALNQQFQIDAANGLYFTMVYGLIDTHSHTIDLCQAGHPHPIFLARGTDAQFIGDGGLPVGVVPFAEYQSIRLNYGPGDRLFIYSDGITECMNANGKMFGADRLLEVIDETRHLAIGEALKRLDERIRLWREGDEFEDDISMLVLEMAENA